MLRWYCNDRRFVLYQSRTARMRTGKLDLIRESMSIPYASWGARILNSMFCLLSPPTAPGTRSNLMALNVQFVCSIILWIHHKLYSNVMLMHPFCVCVCVRGTMCAFTGTIWKWIGKAPNETTTTTTVTESHMKRHPPYTRHKLKWTKNEKK